MGQVSELYRIFELNPKNGFVEHQCPDGDIRGGYNFGDYLSKIIKPIVFPSMPQNASYGVGNKEVPTAQILYEMVTKLQNYRAKKDNHYEYSVTHNEPLHYSDQPLIKVY